MTPLVCASRFRLTRASRYPSRRQLFDNDRLVMAQRECTELPSVGSDVRVQRLTYVILHRLVHVLSAVLASTV